MLDDFQRLRESDGLAQLLTSYSQQNEVNPDAWLDRLMHLEGAEPADLVQWHGELIAFGWIEQNTGHVANGRQGALASCYRITPAGRRAIQALVSGATELEEIPNSSAKIIKLKSKPKKRKNLKSAA